ncbi:hypothetical protein CCUS01_00575 [Colletotrichum cuscutae]|uniref:Uncharacterized protein n=1 Tax=Colletotrichum cuscutae TaxID=1209917 RepID=A0AAI9Y619_9PEZI|nr:hypothetical protein CCUS01_00575 [Colletotrichum cuscutae]
MTGERAGVMEKKQLPSSTPLREPTQTNFRRR